VTGGSSPINFSVLQTQIYNLSGQLAGLTANGLVCSVNNSGSMVAKGGCPSNPIHFNPNSQHYNPSWIVLYGTAPTINVFNITQAEFQNNDNLDIEVPTGSTVIINVAGTSDKLQRDIYFQGTTVTDANASTLLFNFAAATSVTIDGQIFATVLAPYASLSGGSQMGGVFIAASIGSTGQVHYDPFGGTLPYGVCSNTPAALSVTSAAVNTGTVGVAFNSGSLTVSGGTAPYTYSIVGTLPAGLKLNASNGAITGTPTASGTFSVKVTDAHGATSTSCVITINLPPAATPTFSWPGGTYKIHMLVHISEATAGASVHYTTDGSTPTVNSRLYLTADPVQVLGTVTIKAIAVAPGHSQSAVASATYIIK
jgi:choice-of-anchor A domain-containing protein